MEKRATQVADVDPLAPPADAQHVSVADGEAFIWRPAPNVVVQKAGGVLSLPLAECFAEFYRRILVPGLRIQIFDDFEELTLYSRDARELLTDLARERLSYVESIHILLVSKHLALGVSAFKHQIGDERVCLYSDRASFVRSYERALRAP